MEKHIEAQISKIRTYLSNKANVGATENVSDVLEALFLLEAFISTCEHDNNNYKHSAEMSKEVILMLKEQLEYKDNVIVDLQHELRYAKEEALKRMI